MQITTCNLQVFSDHGNDSNRTRDKGSTTESDVNEQAIASSRDEQGSTQSSQDEQVQCI